MELTTFEHNCSSAPCAITQLHFPSIYPTGGCSWQWEQGRFRAYIDGEATASIDLSLLELANVGHLGAAGDSASDGSPFGNSLFGKTAKSGGVYSTVRIPFGKSVRTTIAAAEDCTCASIYWYIVRGVEALPVVLGGELTLPDQARLAVYRVDNATLQPYQFIQIAGAPAGTAGALVSTMFDAVSADPNYLEACVRFHSDAAGASPVQYLSSGTEDFFL